MITEKKIKQAIERIVATAKPSRIILFGSYARGDADEGSDLDFMVIKPQVENAWEEMVRIRGAIGRIGAGVDIVVYSEPEVKRRGQVPGTLIYWALKEGKVMYEATH